MLLEATTPPGTEELLEALALVREAAPPAAFALAEDPLRLDLPALPTLVTASPDALRALGALYFAARLDETGLLQAVEWLVHERASLRVPVSTAARLEDIARRRQDELAPGQRSRLYARLFAVGPAAATRAVPVVSARPVPPPHPHRVRTRPLRPRPRRRRRPRRRTRHRPHPLRLPP